MVVADQLPIPQEHSRQPNEITLISKKNYLRYYLNLKSFMNIVPGVYLELKQIINYF